MAKPATVGKPITLPGRRMGQARKDGTTAPAPARQNTLAPGAIRRPASAGIPDGYVQPQPAVTKNMRQAHTERTIRTAKAV